MRTLVRCVWGESTSLIMRDEQVLLFNFPYRFSLPARESNQKPYNQNYIANLSGTATPNDTQHTKKLKGPWLFYEWKSYWSKNISVYWCDSATLSVLQWFLLPQATQADHFPQGSSQIKLWAISLLLLYFHFWYTVTVFFCTGFTITCSNNYFWFTLSSNCLV